MMFCIFNQKVNRYFCDEDFIIVFNTAQEASAFLQAFLSYALEQVINDDPFAPIKIMQEMPFFKIEQIDISKIKYIPWTECTNQKRRERKARNGK